MQGVLCLKREKRDLGWFLNDQTDLFLWNLGFSTTGQVMKLGKVSAWIHSERERRENSWMDG